MTGKLEPGDLLTAQEVADILGVTRRTLQRWADNGKLIPARLPGGDKRYRRSTIESLLTDKASA